MKNLSHIASRIFNKPLLLQPDYAQVLFGALSERLNIKKLIDSDGKKFSQKDLTTMAGDFKTNRAEKIYQIVDGIAIIPVIGSLTHKLGTLHPYSGMTGYDGLEAKLNEAVADEDVKGILLDIDSPGGEVSGCFDFCDHIYSLRDKKPIWAIANELAASAAYAVGSSASKLFLPRTGEVGSIGVLTAHVDHSKQYKKAGVKVTLIFSGKHKVDGNPFEGLPDDVKADKQAEIDQIRDLFVSTVARNRNITNDQVQATEAQTYIGEKAITENLADEVASFNDVLTMFAISLSDSDINDINRGIIMSKPKDDTVSDQDNEKLNLKAVGDAKKAERERIKAIMTSEESKGRKAQAEYLAHDTEMSAEAAIAILATAPEAQAEPVDNASPLDTAMANTDQPNIGADSDNKDKMSAADIGFASFDSATGRKAQKGE